MAVEIDHQVSAEMIAARRQSSPAYLLLSDAEIVEEILAEKSVKPDPVPASPTAGPARLPPEPLSEEANKQLADWQTFYREVFGREVDLSTLRIPKRRAGFDRLIIVAQDLTVQLVYDKCSEFFTCWKYISGSLSEAVPTNDRTATNGVYAVWIRERVEADQEHRDRSASWLAGNSIQCITLLERLLYELKYFKETGKHLDITNITLCAGSRDSGSGGFVPGVYWVSGGRRLSVSGCYPGVANGGLRAREVVSLADASAAA